MGIGIGFLALISAIVFITPSSRKRIIETYQEWSVFKGTNKQKQTNHRVFIWADGWQVIKEHFWLGTGTGASNDYLYERIKTSNC